jgi:hypothetical protein
MRSDRPTEYAYTSAIGVPESHDWRTGYASIGVLETHLEERRTKNLTLKNTRRTAADRGGRTPWPGPAVTFGHELNRPAQHEGTSASKYPARLDAGWRKTPGPGTAVGASK